MGYKAFGSGTVELRTDITEEEITKLREELNWFKRETYGFSFELRDKKWLDIEDSDESDYEQEETRTLFNILTDYAKEGHLEYTGEDDCRWKFQFNPESKTWEEFTGRVYYSMSEFTDQELLDELGNRGYKVAKGDGATGSYKAVLAASDGMEIHHLIFTRATKEDALKAAQEQMWKEYDDCNFNNHADEEMGAYRGETDCCYVSQDSDVYCWTIFSIV